MKKIFLSIMILLSIGSYAQKLKFGFTGGTTIANYKAKSEGNTQSARAKLGITAGILVDIAVGNHLSIQPALNFTQKGSKSKETLYNSTYKSTLNINCIELPVNVLYNSNGRTMNFFIGGGPSIAIAAGGRFKSSDGTENSSETVKIGNGDDDDMKPLDLGLNLMGGVSLRNFLFSVNYNMGLNNISPDKKSDWKVKSQYFGIRIGYLFNVNEKK
jgi:hypothetical protein